MKKEAGCTCVFRSTVLSLANGSGRAGVIIQLRRARNRIAVRSARGLIASGIGAAAKGHPGTPRSAPWAACGQITGLPGLRVVSTGRCSWGCFGVPGRNPNPVSEIAMPAPAGCLAHAKCGYPRPLPSARVPATMRAGRSGVVGVSLGIPCCWCLLLPRHCALALRTGREPLWKRAVLGRGGGGSAP